MLKECPGRNVPTSKTQGFTIIEVVVAVAIISVTIVGGVMGFSNVLALLGEVRETSTADRLAQEAMEEIRAGLVPVDDTTDRYTTDVSFQGSGLSALTKVTVTVTWKSQTGNNRSRSLVTYFTESY